MTTVVPLIARMMDSGTNSETTVTTVVLLIMRMKERGTKFVTTVYCTAQEIFDGS